MRITSRAMWTLSLCLGLGVGLFASPATAKPASKKRVINAPAKVKWSRVKKATMPILVAAAKRPKPMRVFCAAAPKLRCHVRNGKFQIAASRVELEGRKMLVGFQDGDDLFQFRIQFGDPVGN